MPGFSISALILLVERHEGHAACKKVGCWFVGGDDFTGVLHVLWLQLSPSPPSPLAQIKSRIETFWHRLTQIRLKKMVVIIERES